MVQSVRVELSKQEQLVVITCSGNNYLKWYKYLTKLQNLLKRIFWPLFFLKGLEPVLGFFKCFTLLPETEPVELTVEDSQKFCERGS